MHEQTIKINVAVNTTRIISDDNTSLQFCWKVFNTSTKTIPRKHTAIKSIGARLMHVGDSSIYLNWLLENIYNKVPNSNSGKNYELF